MKNIGDRITFRELSDKTTIVIYPDSNGWFKMMIGAWIAMWYVIGGTMIWALTLDLTEKEQIITVVFLVFWAYYAFKVTNSFLWIMWGKEFIKIDKNSIVIKKSIKNYGVAREYFLENVKNISTFTPEKKSIQTAWEASPWIKGEERVQFEHIGSLIKFGRKLNEKDTKQLFSLVTNKMDFYLKKKFKEEKQNNL